MLNAIGLEGVAEELKHVLPLAKDDGLLDILKLLDRPHQRHDFCAAQPPCIRASKCGVLAGPAQGQARHGLSVCVQPCAQLISNPLLVY
jgi:hypothetical protein